MPSRRRTFLSIGLRQANQNLVRHSSPDPPRASDRTSVAGSRLWLPRQFRTVTAVTINEYYEHTETVRELLAESGREDLARELLVAERTASTSGEAINNIGVTLRRMLHEPFVESLRTSIQALLDEGSQIWSGGHG